MGLVDPSGCLIPTNKDNFFYWFKDPAEDGTLTFVCGNPLASESSWDDVWTGGSIDEWCGWAEGNPNFGKCFSGLPDKEERVGWELSQSFNDKNHDKEWFFWRLQALLALGENSVSMRRTESQMERENITVTIKLTVSKSWYNQDKNTLHWNPNQTKLRSVSKQWYNLPPLALLAHELQHLQDDVALKGGLPVNLTGAELIYYEGNAMAIENVIRYALRYSSGSILILPRPTYGPEGSDMSWEDFGW